jgi:4Fe-4S single cluster domain
MTISNTYCADLQGGMWLQFDTITKQWMAKPCCFYTTRYPVDHNITQEFWKHPIVQKERLDNLQNKELPENCRMCRDTEQRGEYSRRQSWNDRLGTHWQNLDSVIELDLQSDFSCNLACRICGPQYSTLWRQVESKENIEASKKFKVRVDNNNVFEILSTIPMNGIRQIKFQGGEPFISNTHIQILEKLQDTVDLSQISIWYLSNGTTRVTDKVLKFWEKLKMVEIYFSIDDMGPRMEYQRWPCNWQEMQDTLLWFRTNLPHNTLLYLERTMGMLTAPWATELEDWHRENFTETIYGDKITVNYHDCFGTYSLNALTQEGKDYILNNIPAGHWVYNRVLEAKVDNPASIKKMLDHMNYHDMIRDQDWRKVYPEFLTWYRRYL